MRWCIIFPCPFLRRAGHVRSFSCDSLQIRRSWFIDVWPESNLRQKLLF